jgi:4-amino-4-deoxychorismate lyase
MNTALPQFIESIRLENGEYRELAKHQHRLNLTTLAHFGTAPRIDLHVELARRSVPAHGLYKVRVTYSQEIHVIEIEPYTRQHIQGISLLSADGIDYRFKYADRSALNALRNFLPPGVQPLLVQQGLVTDGIFTNVCFFNGAAWLTPKVPLLAGVARAKAVAEGKIIPASISAADVEASRYQKVKLINCMNLFSEAQEITL